MHALYHAWLSPESRLARLALAEKKMPFELVLERPWERAPAFLALNPAGEVPVLCAEGADAPICGVRPILEFLEETVPEPPLMGATPLARAETRRLVEWFLVKFDSEVTGPIVGEKLVKRLMGGDTAPDSRRVRAGSINIHTHMAYLTWLTERRRWLAGNRMTLADLAAAAHLSCVDYAGDVPWADHPQAKDWYARVKSRPAFRPLLDERVPNTRPPDHYDDLDF